MKCYVSPTTFGSLLLVLVCQAGEVTKVVDIRPRILCRGGPLTLVDLVLYPEQLTVAERELVIGEELAWEHGSQLSLQRIAYLLQRHDALHHLRLRGPPTVQVMRLAGSQQVDAVRQAILGWLMERPPWSGWQLDLQFQPSDELLIAQAGGFDEAVVITIDNRQPLGRLRVHLRFDQGQLAGRPVQLSPRLLRLATTPVLTRHLPAGHLLTAADISLQESWIDQESAHHLESSEACLGFELNRRLDAGTVLSTRDLLEPRCAQKGDQVWVECRKGALTVRLIAVAGEHGRRGEQIRLQNTRTGKPFRAKLAGPRFAVLQLGNTP